MPRSRKHPDSDDAVTKRTWGGIQFTYDREDRVWVSKDGIRLYCASAMRKPLSDHWWIEFGGRSLCSGMNATEAVTNFLKIRKE